MKDLTTGKEEKVILKFTIPILVGNIFQQLYNAIDSIVVGNVLGKNYLAAVSASFNIMLIILLIAMGLTLGTNILIAQYYGARKINEVKKAVDTSLVFSLVLSIIITVLGLFTTDFILTFFRVPSEIMSEAKTFLQILLIGTTSSFCYNTTSSILRGIGDSKTPLYFLIISTILNIIFDLLFIIVLKSGTSGAAVATVISQTFSFAGSFIHLNKKYPQLKINIKHIAFDKTIFKLSLKIGLPSAIQKLFISGGFIVIQILINGYGADAMAAYAAAGKIDGFAQMPAMNLGDALCIFTAQNLGANKPYRVNNGYKSILTISSIICAVLTVLIICFPEPLMHLFVNNSSVIKIGVTYLKIISLCYIIYSAMVITNGVILGIGNSLVPMFATILSLWCVQIPTALFLKNRIGITGLWLSIPAGWITGFAFRFFFYKCRNCSINLSKLKAKFR